jgi:integrase
MSNSFSSPDGAYEAGWQKISVRKMILKRKNRVGLTKVYIEVRFYRYLNAETYEDIPVRISTNIWIDPKNWHKQKEIIKDREENVHYKNNELNKLFSAVQAFVSSHGEQEPDQVYSEVLSLDKLRKYFPKRKEYRKTLVDYIEDYYQFRKKRKTTQGTIKEFKTLINRVKSFDKFMNKPSHIESLNMTWSDDFEVFLMNHADNRGVKGYGSGTIEKTYTILITVLYHYWSRRDEHAINISDKFMQRGWKRGRPSKNKANPISPQQLQALYNHQFEEKHLELTKLRFCLQCFTGLRFSDIHRINPNRIVEGKRIVLTLKKTERYHTKAVIPLNEHSRAILKKFDYNTYTLKIANQPYNRNIKDMLTIMQEKYPDLNFKTDHRSHSGRDTFITNAVMAKVDWKTILTWVGQKSYTIMDRYIGITDDYSDGEMSKMFDTMQFIS